MTPAAGALLRLLGSGVSALAGGGRGRPAPVEGASFGELLGRVSDGSLRAGEPVRVDPGSGVELTPDQLRRVGEAASRLEASGASRGLVLIDGMALEYDVLTRTITGEADLGPNEPVANIDAVVRAPGADAEGGPAGLPGGVSNASLLAALASREGNED